jgi:hypothetical protein
MKATTSGGEPLSQTKPKLGLTKPVPPHVNGPNEGGPPKRKPGDGLFPPVPYDPGGRKRLGKPKNRSFQATNDLDYRRYA